MKKAILITISTIMAVTFVVSALSVTNEPKAIISGLVSSIWLTLFALANDGFRKGNE